MVVVQNEQKQIRPGYGRRPGPRPDHQRDPEHPRAHRVSRHQGDKME